MASLLVMGWSYFIFFVGPKIPTFWGVIQFVKTHTRNLLIFPCSFMYERGMCGKDLSQYWTKSLPPLCLVKPSTHVAAKQWQSSQ